MLYRNIDTSTNNSTTARVEWSNLTHPNESVQYEQDEWVQLVSPLNKKDPSSSLEGS